jgi:hypothetical protein
MLKNESALRGMHEHRNDRIRSQFETGFKCRKNGVGPELGSGATLALPGLPVAGKLLGQAEAQQFEHQFHNGNAGANLPVFRLCIPICADQ